jgi:hypothetical protein
MAPVAAAAMVMIAAAIVLAFLAGAIGGALVRLMGWNLAWGGLATFCGYVVWSIADHDWDTGWLRGDLILGAPSMFLAFLVCSASARWLESRVRLRPVWLALLAFLFTLCVGCGYLLLFRLDVIMPLYVALAVDVCLVVMLMRVRRPVRP